MDWPTVVTNDYLPNYGINVDTGEIDTSTHHLTPDLMTSADSQGGLVGNYDDATSWKNYLNLVANQNLYNSAEAQKTREWNQMMRDTEITSYMNQLKENGINPLLAVNGGFSGSNYSSNASAQAYSGTSPYSNSSRVDAAVIRAIGSVLGNVINGAVKLGSLYFR